MSSNVLPEHVIASLRKRREAAKHDCPRERPKSVLQFQLEGSVQIETLLRQYEPDWQAFSDAEKVVRRRHMAKALKHAGFL